jgi:glutathione synthase
MLGLRIKIENLPPSSSKSNSIRIRVLEVHTRTKSVKCIGTSHRSFTIPLSKILNISRFLQKSGTYEEVNRLIKPSSMPPSTTIASLVSGLTAAHKAYGEPKHDHASRTGVLFVVQPNNVNTCDERPLEYALWNQDPPVPAYRIKFGESVFTHTSLSPSQELLYYPPSHPANPIEISVVYMRAGYDPEEYEGIGSEVRLHLERSRAIKCPSILGHLSTFKKVQQALTIPGVLQRFISADKAARIASTFVPLYPLDESEQGLHARKLALGPKTAVNYILKPSLEGGGHNIYRDEIPAFLKGTPQSQWGSYVLMEVINSPEYTNVLLSPQGLYTGAVISELGIFGVCLWRYKSGDGGAEVLENWEGGYSFKTKGRDVDEMSVVKGFGCFDSPCLV